MNGESFLADHLALDRLGTGPIGQFGHLKNGAGTRFGYDGENEALGGTEVAKRKNEQSTDSTPKKGDPPRNWRSRFLAELAATGNVTHSAKVAVVNKQTVYNHRMQDGDFAAAWADAIEESNDNLEAEARRRAVDGVDEPVVYQGELMGSWVGPDGKPATKETDGARFIPLTVKKYSDVLLIFLLKANRPQKFRERIGIGGDPESPPVKVERSGTAITDRLDALTDAFARAAAREEGGGVSGDGTEES